jgi:hypothetical protein
MNPLLSQRIRQFLVHSFLYYRLDESVIPDQQYDELCRELRDLLQEQPSSEDLPYRELLESARSSEGSGFAIRNYPPEIVSTALHLLYQDRYRTLSFPDFLARFGYRPQTENAPSA